MTADPVGILNAEAGSEHLGTWAAAPVAMARQTSARNILAKVWQACGKRLVGVVAGMCV